MAPCERFPEGGWLDLLDKRVSRPIFHLTLPRIAEVAVSIPGSWFGCPMYSVGVVPMIVASAPPQERTFLCCAAGPVAALGLAYWCRLCWENLTTGTGVTKAYSKVGKAWILIMPNMAVGLVAWQANAEAVKAVSLYLSSWFCCQLCVEAVKGIAWRLRPTTVMAEELKEVPRAITDLTAIVQQPSQANLSFPSGDAAGGAIFATAVSIAAPRFKSLATIAAALCGFGRMYFHCHHFLDIIAGQAMGCAATLLVSRYTSPSWSTVLLSQLFTLTLWKPVQYLKPKDGAKQLLENNALDPKHLKE